MSASRSVAQTVALGELTGSIEVATGFSGRGVFLTALGPRGGRRWTIGLTARETEAVARLMLQAARASRTHEIRS
jgi:hypothetical protein